MTRTILEFLKLYAPLALGILIVAAWFIHTRNENHRTAVMARQSTTVALESQLIKDQISSQASDAQFLARLIARRLNKAPLNDATLRLLESDFSDFGRSRPAYYQLRYLDLTGMERVRVDQSFAGPVIIPKEALQIKRKRYYFTESMKAGKNDVYISQFDLNREHSRIEIPLRPTLRYACPVITQDGTKRGIVVLNLDGREMLTRLETLAESGAGHAMLTTGKGYWILGLDDADEWGHLLPNRQKALMAVRYPTAWAAISQDESGQMDTPEGLFTYDTVGVVPGALISELHPSADSMDKRWKIITLVPPAHLKVSWMPLYLSILVLFLILLAAGCWHLGYVRVRQNMAEEQLRESEERTMAISQSAQDAIVMVNQKDQITYWNPAAEQMFRYSRAEAMGKEFNQLLTPLDMQKRASQAFPRFASTDGERSVGRTLEFMAERKDMPPIPVELSVSSFQLKGEWYAVGSMRNITRRKRDELELKRSEETSRALINAPTETVMLIDPDGTIAAINDIGAHRLGGSVDEMVGQNAYNFLASNIAEARREKMLGVLNTGKPTTIEDTRDGRRLLISVFPAKRVDGSVHRLAIFTRDITEQHEAKLALQRSEQRFRDVSEAVGEYIWETDENGRFIFITDDVILVLGYSSTELLGRTPVHLMPEEDRDHFTLWRSEIYDRRKSFSNEEIRNITKDGRIIWLQLSGVPYFDEGGTFLGYRGAAMNITDRKQAEADLRDSERKVRALAESAYDAIVMVDPEGKVSFWNHAAVQLFGYSEAEAMRANVHDLVAPPEVRDQAEQGMHQFALTGNGPAVGQVEETIATRKDGTTFPIERSVSGFRLGGVWYAVATIRDITMRKATEEKLRELATTDSLTGLFNRRRFMELSERELSRVVRYDRSLSMFMMDIDHFKNVNDTYGHDVGDEVLKSLASTARTALRNADVLARLGGEEFGVLLPETDIADAMDVAERLRVAIEKDEISTGAGPVSITISIGVSSMAEDINSIAELLKRADVALYDAKQSGRNKVVSG